MASRRPHREANRIDRDAGMRMSHIGNFLDEQSIIAGRRRTDQHVTRTIENIHGEVLTRKFVPCRFLEEPMLADIITGTLYEEYSGRCLSGRAWLVDAPGRKERRINADGVDLAPVWINDARRKKLGITTPAPLRKTPHAPAAKIRPAIVKAARILAERGPMTVQEFADILKISEDTSKKYVSYLIRHGLIWRKTIAGQPTTIGAIDGRHDAIQEAG